MSVQALKGLRALVATVVTWMLVACPFAAHSRDTLPVYHFAPNINWMNDPNGLVYYQGEYHLFFQYNPFGDRWGHMNWGHAVSRDLAHWQELPIAIPETEVMAFSGSAVVDEHNTSGFGRADEPAIVAIYTGDDEQAHNQSQFLAYSVDRGRHFTRYGKVLDLGSASFRDPKVFWYARGKCWLLVAVLGAENQVLFFTSQDLKHWQAAGSFGPAGARGRDWECPDLFELPVEGGTVGEQRWVLTVNVGEHAVAGGSGAQYFVGDFDGATFKPGAGWGDAPRWVDYGADFYAAVSWNNLPAADHRRLWIGWASNWRYANSIPTFPSRGLMSVPRELTLRKGGDGYRLAQAPARELAAIRHRAETHQRVVLGDAPLAMPDVGGSAELQLKLDAGSATQVLITLSDHEGHQTLIGVNPSVNEVFLDRTRSGAHFHDAFEDRHVAPVDLRDHKLLLHVLVDQSIVELFVNDGTPVITDRFFPGVGPLVWQASARGGAARLDVTAWSLGD